VPVLASNRASNRGRVRVRLLQAVRELLEQGEPYGDVTVEDVARRAGVARSSFYVHFSDRRELLFRLVDDAAGPLLDRLEAIRGLTHAPDGERIRAGMGQALAFARANAGVFRALNEAAAYDREVAAFRAELHERYAAALEERLVTQRRRGRGGGTASRATAVALIAMVAESCFQQVTRDTGVTDAALAAALAEVWERGAYGGA
jgi:AcrR family transcriptional regulator